jgi:hypothetical protein
MYSGILTDNEIAAVEPQRELRVGGPGAQDADVLSLVELDRYHDFFKPWAWAVSG